MANSPNCTLERPDPSEIAERIKTDISVNILNGSPIPNGSNEDVLAYAIGGAIFELWGARDAMWRELNPATMCCDNLTEYAARRGITPRPANRAVGFIRIFGVDGTIIPSGITFTGSNGAQYVPDPNSTIPSALVGGTATIQVTSVLPGLDGNISPGSNFTTDSVIPGIDSSAEIIGGVVGGTDNEDCEALRKRVLDGLRSGVVCANAAWYEQLALGFPGIDRACVSKCCNDCCDSSRIVIYAFGDEVFSDNNGLPPKSILENMTTEIFGDFPGAGHGMAPVGAVGVVTCATPSPVSIRVNGLSVDTPEIRQRIEDSFNFIFRGGFCPGDVLCKSLFINAIGSIIGSNCVSGIEFFNTEADVTAQGDITFPCGHFPVLEEVSYTC